MEETEEKAPTLVVFIKTGSFEVDVAEEVTRQLADICRKVQWESGAQAKLFIEGAVSSLAQYQRAKAAEKGTPIYTGNDFEKGQLASANCKAIAQFLYRNQWFGGFHAAVGGESQPYTCKILDQSGDAYSMAIYPDARSIHVDCIIEPWEPVEL